MAKKILVFGSFVVDLTSRTQKFPAPGETVMGSSFVLGPGGKGSNQAVAAHRAGADVTLATKVGKDVFGNIAKDFYTSEGMNTDFIFEDAQKETGTALIMVNEKENQNMILVVSGACANITDADIEMASDQIRNADFLLLQLEINLDALEKVISIAHESSTKVILNTAPAQALPDALFQKIDIVTPNESEASVLTGINVVNYEDARKAAGEFLKKGVKGVVITMGSHGAYVTDGNSEEIIEPIPVDVIDTTGAGDAFNGGFVMALAEGKDIFEAARYGNAAGALAVTKAGTAPAMPYRRELLALYDRIYGSI
jgi:ribokinase